jgi:hypothetical protein
MSHVLRMAKSPEFAELLKVIYRVFEETPEEAERTRYDRISEFFSSRNPNLVLTHANIKNLDFAITTKDRSLEVYLQLSKERPQVDVHYIGRIVADREGLIGAFKEAGYDIYEVKTFGNSKFIKGKKTQNGKTNFLDIQMGGMRTTFEASGHVDIADFELVEKALIVYEPESVAS